MTDNIIINITILNGNGITFSPITLFTGSYENIVIGSATLTNNSGNSIPVGTEFIFTGTIGTNDNLVMSILVSTDPIPDGQSVSIDVRLTGEINTLTTAQDIRFIPIVHQPVN